jgi:hypothetical protein
VTLKDKQLMILFLEENLVQVHGICMLQWGEMEGLTL